MMNATKQIGTLEDRKMVDTNGLQAMLSSGRKTAVEIGTAAQARVQVGRRVLWNVGKSRNIWMQSVNRRTAWMI